MHLHYSNSCMGEGTLSSRDSAHSNANTSNDPKILSLSTATIPSVISHPAKGCPLITSDESNLPDLLKIWDCYYISCIQRPIGPISQINCHHGGLLFSYVLSTIIWKHVLKNVQIQVKLKFLTNFLIESCILLMMEEVSQKMHFWTWDTLCGRLPKVSIVRVDDI